MAAKTQSKSNGYILHEDSQRVIIATGFKRQSANVKTGNMIQVWILTRKYNPVDAVARGKDTVICGNCPLMGVNGENRTCYVNVGQAPNAVWKAYKRGRYPHLASFDVFRGRAVRFGSYGDPVFIPFDVLQGIAAVSRKWTGYTHQWRNPLFSAYRRFLMASVESEQGYTLAHAAGWRTFRVAETENALAGEILCPNTSRGISCEQCGLCSGTSRQAKSIVIEAHGSGAKHLTRTV